MTTDLENLLPSQETPVEYVTTTDGTVAKKSSVCAKTKKKIKLKKKSTKGNEFKRYGIAFLIGFFLCLIFSSIPYTSRKKADAPQNVPDDNDSKCQKRIIGYYNGARSITEEQIEKLTHIIFNGVKMQKDGVINFANDEQRLKFHDMKNKARNMKSDVQLLFATDAYKDNNKLVAPVMAEPKSRKIWINSIASFILEQELDGVEIVYRWPETSEDRKNFALFVRELRYKLARVEKIAKRTVPYIISIYSPAYNWATKDVSLLDDIRNYVDFFNVETDNFYAPYHKNNIMTGPLSPLYSLGNDDKSIDRTMEKYTCKTMKPSQLNIILSFGGVHWENVHKSSAEPDDIHFYVRGRDYSGYHFTWRYLKFFGFNLKEASFHDVAKTSYIWDKNHRSFVTFENERSLEEKMEYILSKNLGGVAIDRIDKDDDSHTLLNAVTSMNMCSGPKFAEDEIKYNCGKL